MHISSVFFRASVTAIVAWTPNPVSDPLVQISLYQEVLLQLLVPLAISVFFRASVAA